MGKLSTHVLDTTQGKPGAGVAIALYAIQDGQRTLLKRDTTNADGRCSVPLLEGDALQTGPRRPELPCAAGGHPVVLFNLPGQLGTGVRAILSL